MIYDLLINCLVDEISNVGNVSGGLNLTLSCDNVEETFNFLAKILDFDMNIMKCWFLINSILSEAHVFLCLLYFKVSTYLMPLTFNQTLAS